MTDTQMERLEKDYKRVSEKYNVCHDSPTSALLEAFIAANEDDDLEAWTILQAMLTGQAVARFVHASTSSPIGTRTIDLVDEAQVQGMMQELVFVLEQLTVGGYMKSIQMKRPGHQDDTIQDLLATASILTTAISAYKDTHGSLPTIEDRPKAPEGVNLNSTRFVATSFDETDAFNA